ncbi:MAG: ThuA domain-containing protein [Luteolibacter sp.]
MIKAISLLIPALVVTLTISAAAGPATKPLKALLVIGGCCHDYATQKDLISTGIETRANVKIDVCYSPDKGTKPVFACYEKDDWAAAYDVIIHDECAAEIKDPAIVNRILAPHRKGLPAVALHCAMHSYRVSPDFKQPMAPGADGGLWFDFLGVQSTGHGKQFPIEITYVDPSSPITKGLASWTTSDEELYNTITVHPGITPLAKGKQGKSENIIAWTHSYGDQKSRVFSTTLGHNNDTIADTRYLDFVTRGLLWACGKLDKDGKPLAGYGPAEAPAEAPAE